MFDFENRMCFGGERYTQFGIESCTAGLYKPQKLLFLQELETRKPGLAGPGWQRYVPFRRVALPAASYFTCLCLAVRTCRNFVVGVGAKILCCRPAIGTYVHHAVQVAHLLRREEKVTKAHGHARLLAKNYKCLLLMCERHPAHSKVRMGQALRLSAHKTSGCSLKRSGWLSLYTNSAFFAP